MNNKTINVGNIGLYEVDSGATANVIEVDNLTVYYRQVCALSNVSLRVRDKEFLGIIGPNGGGKSTLLKAILGLVTPYSGDIRILGRSPKRAHGIMGYVPQFTSFHRDFPISVEETVLMGRLSGRIPFFHKYSREDMDITHSLMEKLEIYHLRNRQIGQLSGGAVPEGTNRQSPDHQAQDTHAGRAYCQPGYRGKIPYILYIGGTKPGHDHHHGYPRHGSHIYSCGVPGLSQQGIILSWPL